MRTSSMIPYGLVVALAALLLWMPQPAYAAIINVTNAGDAGAGCTLREAIASANADNAMGNGCTDGFGSDIIVLTLTDTYTVTSEIAITSNITIQEGSGITAAISGGGSTRIFRGTVAGAALTIEGLTITSGFSASNGGCIQFDSVATSLAINNSTVQNCIAATSGGAIFIFSGPTLSITNSTFQSNQSTSSGGAIATTAATTIQSSTFNSNTVTSTTATAQGGAIAFTTSTFSSSITGSTFSSNAVSGGSANNRGGAIHHIGSSSTGLSISSSIFTANSSSGTNAQGGAIHSGATAPGVITITSSRFEGNTSSLGVGRAFHSSGTGAQSLTGSCITNHSATAVTDGDTTSILNATGNWWGSSWGRASPGSRAARSATAIPSPRTA